MATVHNYTDVAANFQYTTPVGLANIAIAMHGNAIAPNIVAGPVVATFGFLHANGHYPGLHMNNIYIMSTDAQPAAIWFG